MYPLLAGSFTLPPVLFSPAFRVVHDGGAFCFPLTIATSLMLYSRWMFGYQSVLHIFASCVYHIWDMHTSFTEGCNQKQTKSQLKRTLTSKGKVHPSKSELRRAFANTEKSAYRNAYNARSPKRQPPKEKRSRR